MTKLDHFKFFVIKTINLIFYCLSFSSIIFNTKFENKKYNYSNIILCSGFPIRGK